MPTPAADTQVDKISRWDLPPSVQRKPSAEQSEYCRRFAHRYGQAKYATLAIFGSIDLYLIYDLLIGKNLMGGGSFLRSIMVLIPWLAATIGLTVSFHHRAEHFSRLARHIDMSASNDPQA
jgi:hypothetical protein